MRKTKQFDIHLSKQSFAVIESADGLVSAKCGWADRS